MADIFMKDPVLFSGGGGTLNGVKILEESTAKMIIINYAQLMPSDHSYAHVFYDLVKRAQIED